MDKIKTQNELVEIVSKDKIAGSIIGFTNGCFDILHAGHIRYLKEAKNMCDVLVIGVNSDDSVKRLKGAARPVNSETDRVEVLSALECVDLITIFIEDTPFELIKKISPDVLFKGGDWKEEEIAGSDIVKETGGKVVIVPFSKGYSTTGIIEKMKG